MTQTLRSRNRSSICLRGQCRSRRWGEPLVPPGPSRRGPAPRPFRRRSYVPLLSSATAQPLRLRSRLAQRRRRRWPIQRSELLPSRERPAGLIPCHEGPPFVAGSVRVRSPTLGVVVHSATMTCWFPDIACLCSPSAGHGACVSVSPPRSAGVSNGRLNKYTPQGV